MDRVRIGACIQCGHPIHEGDEYLENHDAGEQASVFVCDLCCWEAGQEMTLAVRDEVQAKAEALINASINAPSPFAKHARILLGEDY